MAKSNVKPNESANVVEFVPSHKLSFETYTVDDYRTLPPQSVERLINLGFSTALKNSKAGLGVTGLGKWSEDELATEHKTHGTSTIEELSAKMGKAATDKQFAAIMSGTAVTRAGGTRGPRAVGIEAYIKTLAEAEVLRIAVEYNKKHPSAKMHAPTKAKDMAAAVERVKTNRPATWALILEEAKRQMDVASKLSAESDDDGADILG